MPPDAKFAFECCLRGTEKMTDRRRLPNRRPSHTEALDVADRRRDAGRSRSRRACEAPCVADRSGALFAAVVYGAELAVGAPGGGAR